MVSKVPTMEIDKATVSCAESRLLLQSDWEVALGQKENKVWAGYQKPGSKTKYIDFICSEDGKSWHPTEPGFEAKPNAEGHSVSLCCNGAEGGNQVKTCFTSPVRIFSSVHKKSINSIDVSNGGLGVSASEENLKVWETKNGNVQYELKGHVIEVYCCRFFPSGLVILSGGADMRLKIWSAELGTCVRTLIGHSQGVTDVGFIGVGKQVISCSKDGTLKIWECGSAQCINTFSPECRQLNSLINLKERGILAVGSESGQLVGYDADSGTKVIDLKVTKDAVNCLSKFDGENQVIVGSQSGRISYVDIRNSKNVMKYIDTTRGAVQRILPIRSGFFASFGDGSVSSYELEDGVLELSGVEGDPIYDLAYVGSTSIYTCSRDSRIRKYKL